MRRRIISATALLLATVVAGCGSTNHDTPTACLEGKGAYLEALAGAPGEVRLAGGTPISDCLAENQQAGDLANVGQLLVDVATKLNSEARADPGGGENVELGYLIGAAQRGADRTEGIHAELMRRLAVAARFSPEGPLPPGFMDAYRRGYDAGHSSG
jgi:hypothetical protein